jgi:serine/threonine-protein kinase
VLDGLAYVHASGFIHGDIQPANVFVCSDGCAKIINFAACRRMDAKAGFAGPVPFMGRVGSPSYMSPQAALFESSDGRSDLFSLGCVLYEMVAGRKPFEGDTPVATLFRVINEPQDMGFIPDGTEWKHLRDVIARALQKKPEDRYPDAGAMRADLALALKELGDSADWTPPRSQRATRH